MTDLLNSPGFNPDALQQNLEQLTDSTTNTSLQKASAFLGVGLGVISMVHQRAFLSAVQKLAGEKLGGAFKSAAKPLTDASSRLAPETSEAISNALQGRGGLDEITNAAANDVGAALPPEFPLPNVNGAPVRPDIQSVDEDADAPDLPGSEIELQDFAGLRRQELEQDPEEDFDLRLSQGRPGENDTGQQIGNAFRQAQEQQQEAPSEPEEQAAPEEPSTGGEGAAAAEGEATNAVEGEASATAAGTEATAAAAGTEGILDTIGAGFSAAAPWLEGAFLVATIGTEIASLFEKPKPPPFVSVAGYQLGV